MLLVTKMYPYVVEWEAIAALATTAAVIVSLWQAVSAKRQLQVQLKHQNEIERQKIEQEYLLRVLDVLHDPFHSAQNFFFEAARLLPGIPSNIAPDASQLRPLQVAMAQSIEETKEFDKVAGNYVDILGAFSERYATEGRPDDSAALRKILDLLTGVVNATGVLREWLADEATIRKTNPATYFDLSLVAKARGASDLASKAVARRLASLYRGV